MRIHRDERGQTIILVALSLPLLLGFVGLATDVGVLLKDKRTIQTAADAAAIAAALNLPPNSTSLTPAAQNAAQAAATANGFTAGTGVTVTVHDPPTWPGSNYLVPGNFNYVEVTISKVEPTIFLALFGHPSVTVLARAVATNGALSGNCVFTGIGINPPPGPALTVTSSMQSGPTGACGLVVDSTNSPPMNVSGTPGLTMSSIGTVGDCSGGACGTNISPAPVSGIIPYSDPLSYLPQFTCNGTTSCSNGTTTYTCVTANLSQPLPPGCYNGITASGSLINLQAGTYVINGPLNLAGGTLSGTNVTIFIAGATGAMTLTGTSLNLSAPTSGTYSGILFAQSSADTNPATINANPNSTIQGFFYFPDSSLLLQSTFTSAYTGFVAQSLTVNSGGTFSFSNYGSAPGVTSSPIPSAVLVE